MPPKIATAAPGGKLRREPALSVGRSISRIRHGWVACPVGKSHTRIAAHVGGSMRPVLMGVVAGVAGTLVMDGMNSLCARAGILAHIDHRMIGRLARGWTRGRFVYARPEEVPTVGSELAIGYVAHYLIGIILAVFYVIGWDALVGGRVSPGWAVAYGVATTVAAYFLLFPSIGLGALGRRSPQGARLPLTSLTNHLFYGLGLAAAIAVL